MAGYKKESDKSMNPELCSCGKGHKILLGEVNGIEVNFSIEEFSLEKMEKMKSATNLHFRCNHCGQKIPFSSPNIGKHGFPMKKDAMEDE